MSRPVCGSCPPCLDITRAALVACTPRTRRATPTVVGLELHALRFGPALVPETAAAYGLTVNLPDARRDAEERAAATRRARRRRLK